MTPMVLVYAAILGLFPPGDSEYETASVSAGRDAEAHLKLAVWCEARGMDAERQKHLESVLSIDPQNAAARGMMGLVAYRGRWITPEQVVQSVQSDEFLSAKLARYEIKRHATPETAKAHYELALWCEQEGLKSEATAHLTTVTRLDPERTDAWRRLGCKADESQHVRIEEHFAIVSSLEFHRYGI